MSDAPIVQPDFTRPTFALRFEFTDFTPDRNLDRVGLSDAIFDLLCDGRGPLDEYDYSCDGWDEVDV